MITLICFLLALLTAPFKSKSRLEAENAALRHQLAVLRRKVRGRIELANGDRLFLIQLYRWFPSVLHAITIIQPETLVRWHRAGFRRYWRWKSRCLGGRPPDRGEIREVMSALENILRAAATARNPPGQGRRREVGKQHIVDLALGFFVRFSPRKPSGSPTGAFATFAREFYSAATGSDPDDHGGLDRQIREAARSLTKRQPAQHKSA